MVRHIKEVLTGFAIGTANIIPGVSGGTFLLILGLYEKTISILNKFNVTVIKEILKQFWSLLKNIRSKEEQTQFVSILTLYGIPFLVKLAAGAGIAIMVLASLLEKLLRDYPTPTFGLFFGLILASVIVPMKLFKNRRLIHLIPFLIGAVITIAVSTAVNPAKKFEVKSANYELELQEITVEQTERHLLQYNGTYSPTDFIMAGIAGAVAISAMVLPGISGSLVLLLLGQYGAILTAISNAKSLQLDAILFLGIVSLGMLLGLLIIVRFVNFVFAKYHDGTVATLVGLIAGSLYALWPFKEKVLMTYYTEIDGSIQLITDKLVRTNRNILPTMDNEMAITIALVIIGICIMIPFIKNEKEKG